MLQVLRLRALAGPRPPIMIRPSTVDLVQSILLVRAHAPGCLRPLGSLPVRAKEPPRVAVRSSFPRQPAATTPFSATRRLCPRWTLRREQKPVRATSL